MLTHLREIDDEAARDGVHTFQTQMEIFVLGLLDKNVDIALSQIAAARTISIDYVNNMDRTLHTVAYDAKAERVALALLEHSFGRLRAVLETPDGGQDALREVH